MMSYSGSFCSIRAQWRGRAHAGIFIVDLVRTAKAIGIFFLYSPLAIPGARSKAIRCLKPLIGKSQTGQGKASRQSIDFNYVRRTFVAAAHPSTLLGP